MIPKIHKLYKGKAIRKLMVKKKSVVSHEVKHEESSVKKNRPCLRLLEKMSKNYWMVATVILAILLLTVLVVGNTQTISKNKVAAQTIDFLNAQTGGGVELVSVAKSNGFYQVNVSYQSQTIPVYVTLDGKNLVSGLTPITTTATKPTTQEPAQTNIPKSDKPTVELYVWGYCPYGVQAQGPVAQVASLLGKTATFTIVPYYDGHGAYETQQNSIQSCIQKLEPTKYWNYAAGFVKTIYPKCSTARTESCDETESVALMKTLGINSANVMACVESQGTALNQVASQKAQTNGVSGSPTLIINGVIANVARTAEAYKAAVCSAYNNAPAECSTTLDSTAAASAGNC